MSRPRVGHNKKHKTNGNPPIRTESGGYGHCVITDPQLLHFSLCLRRTQHALAGVARECRSTRSAIYATTTCRSMKRKREKQQDGTHTSAASALVVTAFDAVAAAPARAARAITELIFEGMMTLEQFGGDRRIKRGRG